MDVRDMKAFCAIVEEGNISGASRRMNVAQPALSRQMKQLEAALGVQLFERGSRRIRLTEAGSRFRERAEHILGLVDGTIKEMTEFTSGLGGTLSIGSVTSSGVALLPQWIQRFHEWYPEVSYRLWEGDGFRIMELLDSGVIEVGIIRAPFDSEQYESIILPDEPLFIAMRKDKFQCGSEPDTVRLAELEGQPLIVPLRWKPPFSEWCERVGFSPRIACISDGIVLNILWAKLGIGMSLVPQFAQGLISDASLIYKRIVDPAVSTRTAVVWVRGRKISASSRRFLELIREMLQEEAVRNSPEQECERSGRIK